MASPARVRKASASFGAKYASTSDAAAATAACSDGYDGLAGTATIGTQYEASLSYPEIRSFYDSELGRHGWSFVSDKPLTDWGGPVVGYLACYRKLEFWAVLQYLNSSKGTPADYALDLTWGSSVCP